MASKEPMTHATSASGVTTDTQPVDAGSNPKKRKMETESCKLTSTPNGLELVIERLITEVIPRYKKKLRQINNHVFVLKMKQEQMIDRKIGPQEAMESVERVLKMKQ